MSPQVIVISGASRGIGFELVRAYSSDVNNIVYAGARDVHQASALDELAKSSAGKIKVIELVSADEEGNQKAADLVKAEVGHVDVLIANAAIAESSLMIDASVSSYEKHFKVNALGPIVLFKSFHSLLVASPLAEPKFLIVSSAAGSLTMIPMIPFPIGPYGMSKAAVNYATAKLHQETADRKLVILAIHPGSVTTDMGKSAFKAMGLPETGIEGFPTITPEQSAAALKKIVDSATREAQGGAFLSYDGTTLPW